VLQGITEGFTFSFRNLDTAGVLEGLRNGLLDIGLVRESAVPPDFKKGKILSYHNLLFIPKRLLSKAGSGAFPLTERLPLAMMEGKGEVRSSLEVAAKAIGVSLNIVVECSSYPQIATAIASGRCAGVLPEFASHFLPQSVGSHNINFKGFHAATRRLCLIWSSRTDAIKPCVSDAVNALAQTWT